ncbi:hypothetical protein C8R47DRAFT_1130791 [Mycena vitilis]|nr:hypothetical protein C8R47DRAFT_1130791 [Mycena vitilis]
MLNICHNPLAFRRHQQRRRNVRLIPPRTIQEKTDVDDERYNTAGYLPRQTGSHTMVSKSGSQDRKLLAARSVTELNGARYQSDDLVDDVFGHYIPASLVGVVLAGLLEKKFIKVAYHNGKPVPAPNRASAIAWAVWHAERAGCIPDSTAPAVEPKSKARKFVWTWTLPNDPNRRMESGAAQFMNSVAALAFEEIHKQAPTALGSRWIQWRFGRPPYPDYAYPMPEAVENVDQRPDNHVLPSNAWLVADRPKEQEADETVLDPERELARPDHLDPPYAIGLDAEDDSEQAPMDESIITNLQAAYHATHDLLRVTAAEDAWSKYKESSTVGEAKDLDEGYANWTRTRVAVELKAADLNDAIRQTHLYLRTLHRAQPWLAAAHGIAMTEKRLCLIRSDAAGCEECSFELSTGRGIIDTIRVALGTVTAENQEFGHNPSFTYKYQCRSVDSSRVQANKKQKITVDYHCHVVNAIHLGSDIFTVQEVISNTASIRGRGTTVFKVWRAGDEIKNWALKQTWVDVQSESQENTLMQLAREKNVKYVLLPEEGDCWTCLDTDYIRGTKSQPPDLKSRGVFAQVELRQETYCLLPYKLPLHHFRNVQDFVAGVICILKGLDSLYTKARLIHGDVSFGNFLFDEDEATPRQAWLFDLDNATVEKSNTDAGIQEGGILSPEDKVSSEFHVVTGTGPFMSLDVMRGLPRKHVSDVESVFYLIFLFFVTFGKPGTDPFLNKTRSWHHSIVEWTTGSLRDMLVHKADFFQYPKAAFSEVVRKHTHPEWQEQGSTKSSIQDLITSAYAVVWQPVPQKPSTYINIGATAQELIKCLEAWLEGMHFISSFLLQSFVDSHNSNSPPLEQETRGAERKREEQRGNARSREEMRGAQRGRRPELLTYDFHSYVLGWCD